MISPVTVILLTLFYRMTRNPIEITGLEGSWESSSPAGTKALTLKDGNAIVDLVDVQFVKRDGP